MPIDPSSIPTSRRDDVIAERTACRSCGYDLQGLLAGGNCPECGQVIAVQRRRAKGDNLTDAPAAYLRRYAAMSLITAWAAPAAVLLCLGGYVLSNSALGLAGFAAGIVFAAVVVPLTAPRPMSTNTVRDGCLDDARWRRAVRLGVAAWPVVACAIVFHSVAAGNGWTIRPALGWLQSIALLAAFAGTVPILIYAGSVASWAGDQSLASRLRGSAWVLSIGTPVILLVSFLGMIVSQTLSGPVHLLRLALLVVYVLGLLVGVTGIAQMAVNAVAAVRTNAAQHARDQRVAERRAKDMSNTVERQFSAPEPVDLRERSEPAPPSNEYQPRIGQGPRLERQGDAEVYELEPDDDGPPPRGVPG